MIHTLFHSFILHNVGHRFIVRMMNIIKVQQREFSTLNLKENLFTILCATKSIPHPEKTHGEDAFYANGKQAWYLLSTEFSFGVADGVGGWREHGIDPSEFSRTVCLAVFLNVQLVDKMSHTIARPVVDASDLKWKAIAAAQSACTSVVSVLT